MKKILCICLSSTIQRTITFESLKLQKVNRSTNYVEHASGKAINSARILEQLESNCSYVVCPLGEENSQKFLDLSIKNKLNVNYVLIPGATRECWTLLDKKEATTTELVVSEPFISKNNSEYFENQEIKILKMIYDLLDVVDGILLAGSKPKGWHEDLYQNICSMAKEKNKIILADFIGKDLLDSIKTACPNIIKINDEEFCSTFSTQKKLSTDELKQLIIEKSLEFKNIIIVTRGADSTLAAKKGELIEIQVPKITPLNTTACGDSFNAGFLYEYLNSNDFNKALQKGSWCATENAKKLAPGTII